MEKTEILRKIEENPVIAAIRNEEDLEDALKAPVSTIFLLHADIFNIYSNVDKIKKSGKNVFIHMDMLEGIGKDSRAIDYIRDQIKPHGIISTKNNHIKYAMGKGMFAIQRVFLIDSLSYENSVKSILSVQPDMVEVLPGIMPGIIRRISRQLSMPVIAGGFIESKDNVIEILGSGALAISTGKKELWSL